MKSKAASEVVGIGGADGPTSVLAFDRNTKPTLKQKWYKLKMEIRRRFAEKRISAEPHSLDLVCAYVTDVLGFLELSSSDPEYLSKFSELKSSYVMLYRPELLGDYAEMPILEEHSETALAEYMDKFELRQKAAEAVPDETVDIDFHLFIKKAGDNESRIIIEKTQSYIGGSASGTPKYIRNFNRENKLLYKYYGVTSEDINNKSQRYKDLVNILSI